jgi:hypothetical protein
MRYKELGQVIAIAPKVLLKLGFMGQIEESSIMLLDAAFVGPTSAANSLVRTLSFSIEPIHHGRRTIHHPFSAKVAVHRTAVRSNDHSEIVQLA